MSVRVRMDPSPLGQKTANNNPFTRSKHKRLGGQYVAPSITDANQTQLHAEEAGCSMARDVKLGTIEEVAPW